MSSRSGSVRLTRQGTGSSTTTTTSIKGDSSGDATMVSSGFSFTETGTVKATSRTSNRRTLNNNNNNVLHSSNNSNGPSSGGGVLVNGTGGSNSSDQVNNVATTNHSTPLTSSASTRSQSTRSSVKDKVLPPPQITPPSSCPMEVDDEEPPPTQPLQQSEPTAEPLAGSRTCAGDDAKVDPPGRGSLPPVVSATFPNNKSTNPNTISTSFPSSLLDAVSAAMEVDAREDSSSDSSSAESSDSSDSEDSSEMDTDRISRQKLENEEDMNELEKTFAYLKELNYKERLHSLEHKLAEVRCGRSKEYLDPQEKLQENMRRRTQITSSLREYRLQNWQHKVDSEDLGSKQNFENHKQLVYDSIKGDLADKIRRLEEDRNNDFTSELWLDAALKRKNKKSVDIFGERKKKPVVVSGPYVVYMLNDVDIVEDWTVIKKALSTPKRKYVDPMGGF